MIFGTEPWGDDLIKTDLGYIGPVKPWETRLYGYELESGVGDWIYNQCRMIMQTEDRSEWAYKIFETCANLLTWRKRWSEEFQNRIPKKRQCNNRLSSFFNKVKAKRGIKCKSRSWGDMTRDPYIAFFTCAVFLYRLQFIAIISIPWYLYRPQT